MSSATNTPVSSGVLVPHPDDEGDVRVALEEADRGELLSPEASAAYLHELLAPTPA